MKRKFLEKIASESVYDTEKYRYKSDCYVHEIAIKRINKQYLATDAAKSDQDIYNPHGWATVGTLAR